MPSFVDRIVADRWTGVFCDEDETLTPVVGDVDRVVDALDAKTRTLVSLYGRDGAHLSIGGGAGRYVVYALTPDDQLWNLHTDEDNRKGTVLLNAGGQEGDYPASQVVNKGLALQAARTFLAKGELDPRLRWERQA
jgi:hypothetical protein